MTVRLHETEETLIVTSDDKEESIEIIFRSEISGVQLGLKSASDLCI